ncbi:hypothetical protein [Catenovulum sediminis]|uniref:Uncharacterized protein n=1 Tax=Catenovulum sediminis TaxID=1740262 RepID=A0ABV1RFV8_9ALTE
MARILHKDSEKIVVTAFPKCIACIALAFLIVFWIAAVAGEKQLKMQDYLIFNGVCLVVIAIQRRRKLVVDKHSKSAVLYTHFLWVKSEDWFSLKDIKSVDMVYGRGGRYARGGAVYLNVKDKQKAIIDSDICFGNAKRNIRLRDEIADWLKL